jgi:type I restriction enzyme R subunit
MSKLLAEVLADLRAKRVDYEEFLKQMAAIAAQVQLGRADDTPEPLAKSPALRAVYNTLASTQTSTTGTAEARPAFGAAPPDPILERAQTLDAKLRACAPDGWRGVLAKERAVKGIIFEVLGDEALVEQLFPVIKAQAAY